MALKRQRKSKQNFKQIQLNEGTLWNSMTHWPLREITQMNVRNGWTILWWGVGRACKV